MPASMLTTSTPRLSAIVRKPAVRRAPLIALGTATATVVIKGPEGQQQIRSVKNDTTQSHMATEFERFFIGYT